MIAVALLMFSGISFAVGFLWMRTSYRDAFKEGHNHHRDLTDARKSFDEFKKQYALAPDEETRNKLMHESYWSSVISKKIKLEAKSQFMGV